MQDVAHDSELVGVSRVARALNTSEGTVRRLANLGRLPHVRVNGQRLFELGVVERVGRERAAHAPIQHAATE